MGRKTTMELVEAVDQLKKQAELPDRERPPYDRFRRKYKQVHAQVSTSSALTVEARATLLDKLHATALAYRRPQEKVAQLHLFCGVGHVVGALTVAALMRRWGIRLSRREHASMCSRLAAAYVELYNRHPMTGIDVDNVSTLQRAAVNVYQPADAALALHVLRSVSNAEGNNLVQTDVLAAVQQMDAQALTRLLNIRRRACTQDT